jgi:hypothetical protein
MATLALNHKNNNNKQDYKKILTKNLLSKSVAPNIDQLNVKTLERLESCSIEFVVDLIKNLNDIGFKDKQLAAILDTHDDSSLLTRSKLIEMYDMFRNVSLKKEIFLATVMANPMLLQVKEDKLSVRLKELKRMFTNNHLDKLLVKSSRLLTDDLNYIIYKFSYVFAVMSIPQEDMCASQLFNHSMSHIRERHLFLLRSGFYDRPNKKGISKVVNPKLYQMVDTDLGTYLDVCTRRVFNKQDYETFCEYLKEENFENELLGYRIGKALQDEIVNSIRDTRNERYREEKHALRNS